MRTAIDFSPLFRSTVGFDRINRLLDAALAQGEEAATYPPYNIEKVGEDQYRITMAVAGFAETDLEIVTAENALVVKGKVQADDQARSFLYKGIAGRAFERRFQLADHIRVTGASLTNGLLHVEMVREVPQAMKPRRIAIATVRTPVAEAGPLIDQVAEKKAA